jgi:hypothetical protein
VGADFPRFISIKPVGAVHPLFIPIKLDSPDFNSAFSLSDFTTSFKTPEIALPSSVDADNPRFTPMPSIFKEKDELLYNDWKKAADEEMSLPWELAPPTPGLTPIPSPWTYKIKRDELGIHLHRFKAEITLPSVDADNPLDICANEERELIGYCDSDYVGDTGTRRSTIGFSPYSPSSNGKAERLDLTSIGIGD